jgi:hypothetical protein
MKSTRHEAPHYAVFSNLLFYFSLVQIFFWALFSQTPSIYLPTLMSETSFTSIQNHRQNYNIVYSNFYVSWQQTRRQKVLDWMVVSITQIQSQFPYWWWQAREVIVQPLLYIYETVINCHSMLVFFCICIFCNNQAYDVQEYTELEMIEYEKE